MKTLVVALSALLACFLFGCAKPSAESGAPGEREASAAPADFVQIDSETTAEERRYLEFGRGVVLELAARDYAAFHGRLSSHARAQISLNQFTPANDDAVFKANEARPLRAPGLPEFLELMAGMERERGRPIKPLDLHVFSTNPDILAGRKKEDLDALEIMFAIGNMPKLAPESSRRASLRAQIQVELSPEQLAEAAKAQDTTPAELAKDPDFRPYLAVKLVLVEEDAALRVGYFEFLPPSMLD